MDTRWFMAYEHMAEQVPANVLLSIMRIADRWAVGHACAANLVHNQAEFLMQETDR